jgi:hypothetical protein
MKRCVVPVWYLLPLLLLTTPFHSFAEERLLLNADFETADLSGWRVAGDVCVAPSFCAGQPTGRYWLAFSTNSWKHSPITLCGGSSVEGMESVLRSPYLSVPFRPDRIRIDFDVKFLTNENTSNDLGTDTFTARFLTTAGPIVIMSIDNSGVSPASRNLSISGDTSFHESPCNPNWRYETGLLHVSYYRAFNAKVASRMGKGPVALEFLLGNHYDPNFDSAAVIDNVQLRIYR